MTLNINKIAIIVLYIIIIIESSNEKRSSFEPYHFRLNHLNLSFKFTVSNWWNDGKRSIKYNITISCSFCLWLRQNCDLESQIKLEIIKAKSFHLIFRYFFQLNRCGSQRETAFCCLMVFAYRSVVKEV